MLRFLARFWAKRKYIFELEAEAARQDINASLAERRATERRKVAEALRKEADLIVAAITEYAEKEGRGYWTCENGHDKPGPLLPESADQLPTCVECKKPAKLVKRELMTGQEKYESDKERKDAEQIAESKRQAAIEEDKHAEEGEQVVKTFRAQAANGRLVADKIRNL